MNKIKLLYFTQDLTNFTFQNREYFKKVLAKHPEVEVCFVQKTGDIHQIINNLPFTPQFIYIDNFLEAFCNKIKGLDQIAIPKGILHTDPQRKRNSFKKFVNRNKINLVFAYYRDAFLTSFPGYKNRFRWLPHHAYPPVFKDYKFKKTINYLMMGSKSHMYPFRKEMLTAMSRLPGFVHHSHPGYRIFSKTEQKKLMLGSNYAQEINKAKLFMTDGSMYHCPVGKYFEIPACNTLLLATGMPELKDLGFIDGDTFVEINKDNFVRLAKHYAKDDKERERIARNGYELIRGRHTTEARVQQFVDYIREAVEKCEQAR
jgi:spore maturation protein CgeB